MREVTDYPCPSSHKRSTLSCPFGPDRLIYLQLLLKLCNNSFWGIKKKAATPFNGRGHGKKYDGISTTKRYADTITHNELGQQKLMIGLAAALPPPPQTGRFWQEKQATKLAVSPAVAIAVANAPQPPHSLKNLATLLNWLLAFLPAASGARFTPSHYVANGYMVGRGT